MRFLGSESVRSRCGPSRNCRRRCLQRHRAGAIFWPPHKRTVPAGASNQTRNRPNKNPAEQEYRSSNNTGWHPGGGIHLGRDETILWMGKGMTSALRPCAGEEAAEVEILTFS